MDYHVRENPGTVSTWSLGGVAALGISLLPYLNPIVATKELSVWTTCGGIEADGTATWGSNQASSAAICAGTKPNTVQIVNTSDTTHIATGRSERDLWEIYLTSITEPIGAFSADHVARLKRVWRQASEQLHADCPIPITQATGEGLQFAWDNGSQYVDVEVAAEGGFYWYFRDRETGEVQGTSNQPVFDLGPDFFKKLTEVVTKASEPVIKVAHSQQAA